MVVNNTTTINTETVSIADNFVLLNSNVTSTPSENAGIEIERGTGANVKLQWNESTDKWQVTTDGTNFYDLVTGATSYVNWTVSAAGVSGSSTVGNGENVSFNVGSVDSVNGLTVTRSGRAVTYGHANTSTLDVTNDYSTSSDGNYIKYLDFDTYGHVVGYSAGNFDARYVNESQTDAISTAMIADNAVTGAKINALTIAGGNIANDTIGLGKLAEIA